MNNIRLTEFTLVNIIERHIHFTKTNTIYDKNEFEDYNEGKLAAYREMLADVKEMKEIEFTNKYLKLMQKLAVQFKEGIADTREVENLSGYNNAILSVLACINPMYEYDLQYYPLWACRQKNSFL